MINKKILLSVFTIGLLACVAGAGTWAYFQDTVTSTGNQLTTATLTSQYSLDGGPWTTFSGDTGASIGPFNLTDRIPGDRGTLQNISIRNMGTTPARVFATITPISLDAVQSLSIRVGTHKICINGVFTSSPVDLGTVLANGSDTANADIAYSFDDSGINQNALENKSIAFDMSIAVKATH